VAGNRRLRSSLSFVFPGTAASTEQSPAPAAAPTSGTSRMWVPVHLC